MSEAKPLRWSFLLTSSTVVAAIWAVVSVFAHSQRARLVDQLVIVIATGAEKEAQAALRQIVNMPAPPIETLVLAAASPSRPIARQSQDSIGEMLRKWQTHARKPKNVAGVAAQLERLAAALHSQRDSFSELDYPWLAQTTERILRLANAAPPEDPLELTIHCEALLATATTGRLHLVRIVPVTSAEFDVAPDAIFTPPPRKALESIVTESASSGSQPEPLTSHPPRRFNVDSSSARKVATPIPVEKSLDPVSTAIDPWASIDTRVLLERWLTAEGNAKLQIERELKRRGFGELRSDVVRLGLDGDTTARVQLVHDLPALPAVGVKAWLMLLAEDKDAEVRLAAVTLMTISRDRELLEKAWQVALHDRDPRIAGLAEKLRDRR